MEDKVTKGTKFVNLQVERINNMQSGLKDHLNEPFYKPDLFVLKRQLRL